MDDFSLRGFPVFTILLPENSNLEVSSRVSGEVSPLCQSCQVVAGAEMNLPIQPSRDSFDRLFAPGQVTAGLSHEIFWSRCAGLPQSRERADPSKVYGILPKREGLSMCHISGAGL